MAKTFLEAVNEVLVETNEVQLTSANFSSAKGIHQFAKNAINRAYLELCAKEVEWPFLAAANSNTYDPKAGNSVVSTTQGVRWYLLKPGSTSVLTDYSRIDWDTFYITTQGVSGETAPYVNEKLFYIEFDEWAGRLQAKENADASSADPQYGTPVRVIASQDGRYFGLSPIPDKEYKVYFSAWVNATPLSAHNDTLLVPDMYFPTVFNGAMDYVHCFKKDFQEAAYSRRKHEEGVRNMRRTLMGRQSDTMRDDRIR